MYIPFRAGGSACLVIFAFGTQLDAQVTTMGRFQSISGAGSHAPVSYDCAIAGSVVNSITGEPIPRAHIMLRGAGQTSGAADNSGLWSFTNVACGNVQVMVTRPGFLQGNSGRPGPVFRPTILTSGSPMRDVKIQLTPQAVLAGKVLDDAGDPVMNAQISAMALRVVEGRRTFQPTGSANSNDLGEFRIASLQAGKYVICAHLNPGMNGGDVSTDSMITGDSCYPGPPEGGVSSAMDLAPGRENRVDFNLQKVPAVHVRGTVSGLPKNQGVGLQLIRRGLHAGMGSHPANISQDGRFDVRGVTAGAYMLASDYWDGGKRLTARLPVDVGSSDVDGIVLRLDAGLSLTGTVRVESKSGAASLNQQFNISLRSSEPALGSGPPKWNADHTAFTIDDLSPGTYRLDAFAQGPWYLKSAMLGGRDISREEVPITQSMGPINVVMSDDGGSIEGHVGDANDQPVASFVMALQEGRLPRNVMTGPDGHFRLQNIAPGSYRVFAWDDTQNVEYANPEWMQRYASGTQVNVESGQTVQLKLTQQTAPQ